MDSLDKFSLKYIYNLLTFYFKGMISYVGNTLTIQNPKYTNYIIPIGYNQQVFRRETLKNCTCVFRINWKNLFIAALEIYTIILMFPWIRNFSQLYEVTGEYSSTLFMSFIKKVGIILLAFVAIKIITSKKTISQKIKITIGFFLLLFALYKAILILPIFGNYREEVYILLNARLIPSLTTIVNTNKQIVNFILYFFIACIVINCIGCISWFASYHLFINGNYLTSFFLTEKKKAFACRNIITSLIDNNEILFKQNIQFFYN